VVISGLNQRALSRSAALVVICLTISWGFQESDSSKSVITSDIKVALEQVRADSLRGDLSFLASDLLEGRKTPSRGLEIAAEYIAAQFRGAGLEPGGDHDYFQTARMAVAKPELTGFTLTLSAGERQLKLGGGDVVHNLPAALDVKDAPIFKLDLADGAAVEALSSSQVAGKAVLIGNTGRNTANRRAVFEKLRGAKAAFVVMLARTARRASMAESLIDPDDPRRPLAWIAVTSESASEFFAALKPDASGATASVHAAAPIQTPVELHNVIGILRGSDPVLKDTCILLTAHYDHLGERPEGPGDRIYNGANDDGSGTVSVIETARAIATLKQRPRRSIVFMTFFGEEEGLVGSRYYASHPAWPLEKTMAQLNLEQVGRTDGSEGPQISNATLTGFDYSDVADYLLRAGEVTGVKLYRHSRNSDAYFGSSDNLYLAERGVPAHTLAVTFGFPDYHGVGDEWQKIDYDNMAKVDRTVALAVIMLANAEQPPHWNAGNPKTAPFVKAWKERHK
jgi:peptidase M28-like protein